MHGPVQFFGVEGAVAARGADAEGVCAARVGEVHGRGDVGGRVDGFGVAFVVDEEEAGVEGGWFWRHFWRGFVFLSL